MRSHTHTLYVLHFQFNVSIDHAVTEHTTACQELTIFVQGLKLAPKSGKLLESMRLLLVANWYKSFRRCFTGESCSVPVGPAINKAAKHKYGFAKGSGKRASNDVLLDSPRKEYG